ncbi:leucyl aminopeptidase family protein [Pontibaca methylaminivorans]|uniref:Leucyl aminopeptidase n=1 Tax=Pontibaca methylaminivorans TaxID=515897 RepID=A0A1R3WYP6_9RHOB|nr:leucyl aminopeptidase family protein [Pontibaca methylaminivorans]SIT83602.1 leucyl aminopeptidase [Pontibaca methylaminivorans]
MSLSLFSSDPESLPLHVIETAALSGWLSDQAEDVGTWVRANGFRGKLGEALLVPGAGGRPAMALAGFGSAETRARGRFALAAAAARLPEGSYRIVSGLPEAARSNEALGWLLAGYRFDHYAEGDRKRRQLVAPDGVNAARLQTIAAGECLARDLINTPASDMGPAELEAATRNLAARHGAHVSVVTGDHLLDHDLPLIHAVGRAAAGAPRLIDMSWGESGPALTLVGKGVCFDTGGLNLKPGSSMGLMKKDMGGAANVLGLAHMIMALGLPLRLRVLIPAVENSVSGSSMRPGDILTSRKGLTVEVNNTDAEGRLVLADALALAAEDAPDLLVSMATLTGAARVALGPDIAPFFTDDDTAAQMLADAGENVADPVWRLPFHMPYEAEIEPGIADLDNAPSGGFAGAITAALFLRRFAGSGRYVHWDIYGWQPKPAPARPKGGVGQGIRAMFDALPGLLGL